MKNESVKFKVKLLPILFTTIVTWLPLLSVLVPVLIHGSIDEVSLGTGTRFKRSPESYFLIMTLCTLALLVVGFVPMYRCVIRGHFAKFSEDSVYIGRIKFDVNDILQIEYSRFIGHNFKFILKSGNSHTVSSNYNSEISDYITKRFSSKIVS